MSLVVYNSLTKQKEALTPADGKTFHIYSCGVTVYDKCHLGHARSLYIFDMITRYIKYRGYGVHFVRNLTDVDDKIIQKANSLNKTFDDVVAENIALYQNDLKNLDVSPADQEPRATDNIAEIIAAIETLIAKGHAYEVEGDVYFSVRSFKEYGKLSGQSIEKMLDAVRIEKGSKKKDPLDFALWKTSKEGEPFWTSPWGDGRPGWHIECSCMSMKYLGLETLDIHAGGRDLIFPHHENEVAQSEALTGKPFARYWMHNGLLTINKQKMAKSLGNFITIDDALSKFNVNDLKMFFLTAHYSSAIDFSDEKMVEMHKVVLKLKNILAYKKDYADVVVCEDSVFIKKHKQAFLAAMDDDFNTAKALGCLFEFISEVHKKIDQESEAQGDIFAAIIFVEEICQQVFGLSLSEEKDALSAEQMKMLKDRLQARANKNFQLSDELRDTLAQQGIIVEDTKDGQRWKKA